MDTDELLEVRGTPHPHRQTSQTGLLRATLVISVLMLVVTTISAVMVMMAYLNVQTIRSRQDQEDKDRDGPTLSRPINLFWAKEVRPNIFILINYVTLINLARLFSP